MRNILQKRQVEKTSRISKETGLVADRKRRNIRIWRSAGTKARKQLVPHGETQSVVKKYGIASVGSSRKRVGEKDVRV